MYADAKIIHIIERLVKVRDEKTLDAVSSTLDDAEKHAGENKNQFEQSIPNQKGRYVDLTGIAGSFTEEEADEFDKIIQDAFGQVNPDDVKFPFE